MNLYRGYLIGSEKTVTIYADNFSIRENCIVFYVGTKIEAVYPAEKLVINEIDYNYEIDN